MKHTCKPAWRRCRTAWLQQCKSFWTLAQVMVITGDNKLTAEAICRKIGVFDEGECLKGKSMTGREFVELPMAERRAILEVRTR